MPKRVCLPKKERDDLLQALKKGEPSIGELYKMSSPERRAAFEKLVGEDDARLVNAKFEAAMVSKHKNALERWVKSVTSAKEPIRRDMLKRVERVKDALETGKYGEFLEDLASEKVGINVTQEEAETILRLKENVDKLKAEIPADSPKGSQERMAYGLALDRFKNYVGELKLNAESLTWKERAMPVNYVNNAIELANFTKGLVATLDNSFIGRQGIKTLLSGKYKLWGKTFVQSLELFGKELFSAAPDGWFKNRSDAVMAGVRAEIWSRQNALNGKYAAAKNAYGLGLFQEEVFPSSLPERIPLFGRLFKASETAFKGSAMLMRANLADAMIAAAEKNGIDVLDETQATALGSIVGSMTGRGELTRLAPISRGLNAFFFAPRFLKANFNTITAHTFDKTMTPYGRRVAATNTLRIAATLGAVLSVADMLNPGSVDWDPRSSNFGTIKVGQRRLDITGGMKGLVNLATRIMPTIHNGELGFWTKSSATGAYTKMSTGEFGEQTALDTFQNFFEGKLSPGAGVFRDVWKGQRFGGEKPGVVNTTIGLITPISAQILQEELAKGNDDLLLVMLAESFGFSATDTTFMGYGKRWQTLADEQGEAVMNDALKKVTERFNERAEELQNSNYWEQLDSKQRSDALKDIRTEENDYVLRSYGL